MLPLGHITSVHAIPRLYNLPPQLWQMWLTKKLYSYFLEHSCSKGVLTSRVSSVTNNEDPRGQNRYIVGSSSPQRSSKPGGRERPRAGLLWRRSVRPSRQGIPRLGEQWKATYHAAAFPGKLMKPPGGIWGTSENAKDGGGSTEYHLGIRVVPDA